MTLIAKSWQRLALVAMLSMAAVSLVACSDDAEDVEATEVATEATTEAAVTGGMEISDVWARATAGNPGENTAIYAMITNNTGEEDVLSGVRVGEEIAARSEVHEMVQQGENIVMQEVEGGIAIAASEMAMLEPGGYHVMLMGVASQLTPGQTFPATFIFERAGEVDVQVEVREASSMGSMGN